MTPLTRVPDWQSRLRLYLRAARHRPLTPGQHDCCLFAAGAVAAQTGVDLAAGWRGRYTTIRGGYRVLRAAGYADHVALIAAHLPETSPSRCAEGDIAVLPGEDGIATGVIQGEAVYVLWAGGSLTLAPIDAVLRGFKVGGA
ncbi:DUF6950 family protein [Rhodobacter maris]|uniref:DUF6950 domain-containing protein n=1 Tax=Rhodobacter maris TaxID=446682 RepID=A0A285TJB0_9RHOB|nr:hypothetical protein [Rhodobacter maris]SOC20581.1 hypothetical protein SAMN05877831_1202 [Rhodobacter maris]